MELQFKGTITEIRTPRYGETAKGEWANAEFEVTELNPQNEQYPQVALFDFFKNGEYVKYAKDFSTYYKVGDSVIVHFNLKKNEYTKQDGTLAKFYKTSAWKIEKLGQSLNEAEKLVDQAFPPATDLTTKEQDDLPF